MSTFEVSIEPELAARLQALADAEGVDVQTYIRNTIQSQVDIASAPLPGTREEHTAAWLAWTQSHGWNTAVAVDDRESIYAGRGESES
ncbi:MAG: hypothetical protein HZA51_08860 [Planctomycetes bacterium]|nr:hypothetical protein [Planctomycetota bacterium]